MAAKRPSYKSIRARQRNIIEGIGTGKYKYKDAADRFGVTPRELKKFIETKPKTLRENYNRSPAYKKLYGAGRSTEQRKEVREKLGVPRIKRYRFREREIQDLRTMGLSQAELRNKTQIGEQIQNLYTSRSLARYDWASYSREHDLPTSINTIKFLHRNNKISDDQYADAVSTWRNIYNVSSERASLYEDDDRTAEDINEMEDDDVA